MKSKLYGKNKKTKRIIYLVAPKHPENFWIMQGLVDVFGKKSLMPNAALATLMALTPDDVTVEYKLCDENVSNINFNMKCDLVAITGSTLHAKRIKEICRAFKEKGKQVALGGTYASINPEECTSYVDYLFVGEAELTWPQFLHHWFDGRPQSIYRETEYIDIKNSPAPDWSLIKIDEYVHIPVQTTRGCPNECDFCDVIQYYGRRYRKKTVQQILNEIKNLHARKVARIFFSDDNFLGDKRFSKKLLREIIAWNRVQTRPIMFSTQLTIQLGEDEELLKMLADANFTVVFVGVETVRKKSLEEVHKKQNINVNIPELIRNISRFGILPFIGLIVGFDNDDVSVFSDLNDFILDTMNPIAGISLLNAPKNTPLFKRLEKEGRLDNDFTGEWQLNTNIVPKQMTREVLIEEYKKLFKKLYEPEEYFIRIKGWLDMVEYKTDIYTKKRISLRTLFLGISLFSYFIRHKNSRIKKVFLDSVKYAKDRDSKLIEKTIINMVNYEHFYQFTQRF